MVVKRDEQPYCAEHDSWDCPILHSGNPYQNEAQKCIVVEREGRMYCSTHDSFDCEILETKTPKLYCDIHNDYCGVLIGEKNSPQTKLKIVGVAQSDTIFDRRKHTAYDYR